MKAYLLTILFLITAGAGYGQQVSNVNFDAIKTDISDTKSNFYYPLLLKRFQAADTTLTAVERTHLYYGQIFTDTYSPYGSITKDFNDLCKAKNYKKAISVGEKALVKQPLDAKLIFRLLVCYYKSGDRAMAASYATRYHILLGAIIASGDGKSRETAYVVANVADEYDVLASLGLSSSRQALVGHTDVLTVTVDDGADKSEREVYFDVSKPLQSLRDEFKKK